MHLTLFALALPLFLLVLADRSTAAGDNCHWEVIGGKKKYICNEQDPGDPGSPGHEGGKKPKPSCDLKDRGTFCRSGQPCYYEDWHPPYVPPDGDPPSEESKAVLVLCLEDDRWVLTDIIWAGPGQTAEPPLADQAREAIGEIELPTPSFASNPAGRTYVNLATGYWVKNGHVTERRGTSAFGLVAVATLRELRVDPGDGTGTVTCSPVPAVDPGSTAGSCRHTYTRASVKGPVRSEDGDPAYAASMVTVWDLTFVNDGVEVTIAGAPETITSDPGRAAVPVGEIQARVIG